MTRTLLIASLILNAASGLPALALRRDSRLGQRIATALVLAGCVSGFGAALLTLIRRDTFALPFPWQAAGGSFLGLDALSAFFLIPLFLVSALGSIYGLEYWPQHKNAENARRLQFFWGTMTCGIALLFTARHGMAFLFGWEAMALSAFFLVGTEDSKPEARRASWIYLVATHIGTLTLFCMFALWAHATGSFALSPVSQGTMSFAAMNIVFLLAFVGFGLKAGVMPMHFWLPGAHANAPSHVSAMLSGIMLKAGVYGLLRVLSLLPSFPSSWGILVLLFGSASALVGILFALAQDDFKRALAYSSIENVGIIMMGLGIGMIGRSTGQAALVALGLGGALLHVWNHSLFKPMLFFAAGSVLHSTGTRRIDALGGLAKTMPLTAFAFFAGALAIGGLPPLNGFVSEFFIYVGLLLPVSTDSLAQSIAIAAPLLALVGALALACFVRLYGTIFAGVPRKPLGAVAHDGGAAMIAPMFVLVAACAFIGIFPGFLSPVLGDVSALWLGSAGVESADLGSMIPFKALGGLSATLLALAAALFAATRSASKKRAQAGTWDCGYAAPDGRMQYTGSSVSDSFASAFAGFLRPKIRLPEIRNAFPAPSSMSSSIGDPVLDRLLLPLARSIDERSLWIRKFQQGIIQNYLLYILITITVLLAALIPFREIFAELAARWRG